MTRSLAGGQLQRFVSLRPFATAFPLLLLPLPLGIPALLTIVHLRILPLPNYTTTKNIFPRIREKRLPDFGVLSSVAHRQAISDGYLTLGQGLFVYFAHLGARDAA